MYKVETTLGTHELVITRNNMCSYESDGRTALGKMIRYYKTQTDLPVWYRVKSFEYIDSPKPFFKRGYAVVEFFSSQLFD